MKKVLVTLVIAVILLTLATTVFASDINLGQYQGNTSGQVAQSANNIINIILGVVKIVAVGVAVIMLVVLAIRYMTASPSEKGDLKQNAFKYVIGALILFGGVAILQMLQYAGQQLSQTAIVPQIEQVQNIDKLG